MDHEQSEMEQGRKSTCDAIGGGYTIQETLRLPPWLSPIPFSILFLLLVVTAFSSLFLLQSEAAVSI